ncbi:hypothetical protein NP569_25475, partial [Vibrio parahaemolyticus]|nr:hypothetical protein [Vibrio parahaemolyticus]
MRIRAASLLTAALLALACRGEGGGVVAPSVGNLKVLLVVEPASLDPQLHFDDISAVVLDNVFDPLVRFGSSMRL